MDGQVITLVSSDNVAEYPDNCRSAFTNVLPHRRPCVSEHLWKLNLETLCFRPYFANMPSLEKEDAHLIAFHCSNLETEALEENIDKRYWLIEKMLSTDESADGVDDLLRMLNGMFRWELGEGRLQFSMGERGMIIEGDGEVVVLLSPKFCKWVGLEIERRINFIGVDYRMLDFSRGRRDSVEGNKTELLKVILPSAIRVMLDFEESGFEAELAMLPFFQADSGIDGIFFSGNFYREYMNLGNISRLTKLKVVLRGMDGRQLRLVKTCEAATVVRLTLKRMEKGKRFTLRLCSMDRVKNEIRKYFDPPLPTSANQRWQMALQSAYVPASIRPMTALDSLAKLDFKYGETRTNVVVPSTYFESDEMLANKLALIIYGGCGGHCVMTTRDGHVVLTFRGSAEIGMSKKMADILGMQVDRGDDDMVTVVGKVGEVIVGEKKINVERFSPLCIILHCDAVSPSSLGSRMEHVVEVMPTTRRCGPSHAQVIVYESSSPNFVDIDGEWQIPNMLFSLRTIDGKLIQFADSDDKVYLNVLFREKIV